MANRFHNILSATKLQMMMMMKKKNLLLRENVKVGTLKIESNNQMNSPEQSSSTN